MRLFLPLSPEEVLGFSCTSTDRSIPLAMGPCSDCMRELSYGQRDQSAVCSFFRGAVEGAATCQYCSHSWHSHQ